MTTVATRPPEAARAIRRNRPLAMLVASIFTYRLAGAMLVVALPFFAVHRFGFGVGAGLGSGAWLLPNILFGLVVGHLVDRWSRETEPHG